MEPSVSFCDVLVSDINQASLGKSISQRQQLRNKPTKFICVLYGILKEEAGLRDILTWVDQGLAFKILDERKFIAEILPRFFKSSKMNSFVRQLNMYGFKKCLKASRFKPTDSHSTLIFKQINFRQGREDLLSQVRRPPKTPESQIKAKQAETKVSQKKHDSLKANLFNPSLLEVSAQLGFFQQLNRPQTPAARLSSEELAFRRALFEEEPIFSVFQSGSSLHSPTGSSRPSVISVDYQDGKTSVTSETDLGAKNSVHSGSQLFRSGSEIMSPKNGSNQL